MPPLSRGYIKLAMVYLIAALLVGALQALLGLTVVGPTSVHMLVVGWVTQMIFGVAYWMFPKYTRETPRGDNFIAVAGLAQALAALGFAINTWPRVKVR